MIAYRFLWRQLCHLLSPDRDLYFPYGRINFLQMMMRWHREAMSDVRLPVSDIQHPFTIILQSYKRPWNIEPLVKMFLRFDCVERVVVSNNNERVACSLQLSDSRVEVINQPRHYPASKFAMIAFNEAQKGAQYFLCLDDDLFLFPHQIAVLMRALQHEPHVPHGLVGQIIANDGHALTHHLTGESAIDVLNRVYAFTDVHLTQYMRILNRLGYSSDEEKAQLPFGSDMVLSCSTEHKPQIHDVGELLNCPTNAKPGIARFKDHGFSAFREELWRRIHAA